MSLLVVDQNKCDRDGRCTAVCPAEINEYKNLR